MAEYYWDSPRREFAILSADSRHGILYGGAIERHTRSAHDGKIDPTCPACKELLAKKEKGKK